MLIAICNWVSNSFKIYRVTNFIPILFVNKSPNVNTWNMKELAVIIDQIRFVV